MILHPSLLPVIFDLTCANATPELQEQTLVDMLHLLSFSHGNRSIILAQPNWQNWFLGVLAAQRARSKVPYHLFFCFLFLLFFCFFLFFFFFFSFLLLTSPISPRAFPIPFLRPPLPLSCPPLLPLLLPLLLLLPLPLKRRGLKGEKSHLLCTK